MSVADWIAADWGNTHLRLWALGANDTVLERRVVARGLGNLQPGEWEGALLAATEGLLAPDRATDVLICGAAGSRGGWQEAPYRTVPCTPNGGAEAMAIATADPRLRVHVLPGINQLDPPAVMRSEETQIAGFLAANASFDGVVCLPGTHTKWAHVSAGEVVSFMSSMTGELFALLSQHSILRKSVAEDGHDDAAFLDGVAASMRDPGKLISALISLRAEAYLAGLDPVSGRARLSGLLIGADLSAARFYWLGRDVAVIGAAPVRERFGAALDAQGVPVRLEDGEAMALAGLIAAHGERS